MCSENVYKSSLSFQHPFSPGHYNELTGQVSLRGSAHRSDPASAHITLKGELNLIEVSHLTKRYGSHTAVSDLSFTIDKGQIYGFLGPNGAGKSTTMNIMTGCLAATSGLVKIDGHDIFEEPREAKRRLGYLPEQPPVYLDRTPWEYLTFVGLAKGIPDRELPGQIRRVMGETQIADVSSRLIKNLSKGYRQRVGIAQAILGDPETVILDEPTVGLDPKQIIEIRELIQSLGKSHTVVLSSHILSEVQAVCQTVLILSKGRLVACDTPENLERLFAGSASIEITAEATGEQVRRLLSPIGAISQLDIIREENGRCHAQLTGQPEDGEDICRRVFFAFCQEKLPLLQLNMVKASLEDIFLELTGGEVSADRSGGDDAAEPDGEEVEQP